MTSDAAYSEGEVAALLYRDAPESTSVTSSYFKQCKSSTNLNFNQLKDLYVHCSPGERVPLTRRADVAGGGADADTVQKKQNHKSKDWMMESQDKTKSREGRRLDDGIRGVPLESPVVLHLRLCLCLCHCLLL